MVLESSETGRHVVVHMQTIRKQVACECVPVPASCYAYVACREHTFAIVRHSAHLS